jgi:hypothetical protein
MMGLVRVADEVVRIAMVKNLQFGPLGGNLRK